MGYVMVPVPEEHADEIGQLVLSLSLRQKLNTVPPGAVASLVERVDDTDRAVLRSVAIARKVWLDVAEVLEATGIDRAEFLRRSDAINGVCREVGAPFALLIRDDGDDRHSVMVSAAVRADLIEQLAGSETSGAASSHTPSEELR